MQKQQRRVFDTITLTVQAAGSLDVATLNLHFHRLNEAFFQIMDPQIVVLQGWRSNRPPDSSFELLLSKQQQAQNRKPPAFATDMFVDQLMNFGCKDTKIRSSQRHNTIAPTYCLHLHLVMLSFGFTHHHKLNKPRNKNNTLMSLS